MTNATYDLRRPTTVTFDCWATLIYQTDPISGPPSRAAVLAERLGIDEERARSALAVAWRKHQIAWHRRTVFDGRDMTLSALETLDIKLDARATGELVEALETYSLGREVVALDGARATLEALAERGVRRALICDTGYTPGRVVRTLLERAGLLDLLEVTVFSDEVRVPKPHPDMFQRALEGLGVSKQRAVHVGDLRRSDVAGGRTYGMGTIRLSQRHDDSDRATGSGAGVIDCRAAGCTPVCERPEAHAVAPTYERLLDLLGYST